MAKARKSGGAEGRGADARMIRVIGGSMRGRKWRFPDVPEVRPTPDRVRETLFNWLAPRIAGARCLDLFAGSGALGIEALSRGASRVVFVEQNAIAARAIVTLLTEWGVRGGEVRRMDALSYLQQPAEPFDIVFLDPPFAAGVLTGAAAVLEEAQWLAPQAVIYVECAAREPKPALPERWQDLKAGQAGEVGYHLFARSPGGAVPE